MSSLPCGLNVEVVLPVPESPMMRNSFCLDRAVALLDGCELGARVHHETALAVDEGVQHPQATLLGLTEVVGTHDAGDVVVGVDEDHAALVVTVEVEAGRVDDLHVRLPVLALFLGAREVENLLHRRHVGALGGNPERRRVLGVGVVADVPVDADDVRVGEILLLQLDDLLGLGRIDRLAGDLRRIVGDRVGVRAERALAMETTLLTLPRAVCTALAVCSRASFFSSACEGLSIMFFAGTRKFLDATCVVGVAIR